MECMTVSDIEYFSSGESATCMPETGLTCLNADNSPVQCSDYKIRYLCHCPERQCLVSSFSVEILCLSV